MARIETITRVEATTRVAVGVWEMSPDDAAARDREMPEAPDFEPTLLDGETVQISDYRVKTVVLVMWASWCPYCNEEFPMYEEMWQEMRDDDVVFLGVGLKNDDQGEAEDFVEKHGATYGVIERGSFEDAIRDASQYREDA